MELRVLDRVRLLPLEAKTYFRVFEHAWGDVFTTNPNANGRLSLKQDLPRGATGAAAWYVGDTLRAALWETVLRDVAPDDQGGVDLDPRVLAKWSMQAVRLRAPATILRMEPAQRRHVVLHGNDGLNAHWDRVLATELYELTHAMAGLVQMQCATEVPPLVLPGIAWRSRQAPADLAYVLYDPPLDRTQWAADDAPIPLLSPAGLLLLRAALAEVNMVWLNDPAGSGRESPLEAL